MKKIKVSYAHSYAFTLAEMVVTIVILSIVFLITITKVIGNNQQTQFDTKYNKIAAIIESNIKNYMVMTTGLQYSDFTANADGHNYFIRAVKSNLAFKTENCALNRCWGSNLGPFTNGAGADTISNSWNLTQLQDDTTIAIDGSIPYTTTIYIDVNGRKGPNQLGRDIRLFENEDNVLGR